MDKRRVQLTWQDAADPGEGQSWYSDEEVEDFSACKVEVVSLGWVKSITDKYVTLCADYIINEDGTITWGRPTKVPVGMITLIEDLEVVKKGEPGVKSD